MALMNERPNNYRRVPYAEHEASHLFKVMRHFPELAKTMPEVHDIQVKAGRNWVDQKKPGKEKPREISYTTTRKLTSLKKSLHGSVGVGGQMNEVRKVLLCSRNPQMAKRLQETSPYLENGSLSTNPSRAPTALLSPGIASGDYNMTGNGTIGLLEDSGPRGPESRPHGMAMDALQSTSIQEAGSTATVSTEKYDKYGNLRSIDPLESANSKLAKASVSYAPTTEFNILAGFQGQDLNEEEFNVQLKRCLQVNLTKKELFALFRSMDVDGSGLIDGVEFTRYFLTVGNIAREKVRLATLEKHKRDEFRNKQHAIEEAKRIQLWEKSQVSNESTEEHEQDVFKKLAKVALHWDNGSNVAAAKLAGFDAYLTPFEFKVQLESSFDLYLDKEEMGALCKRYRNRDGEHCIDGKAFLQSFSTLRRSSRVQHVKELKKYANRKKKVLNIGKYFGETSYTCLGR